MDKLTAEQKLTRATVWLMNSPDYAIFSGLYLMGSIEVKDNLPTACTNGRDEFYGRAFIESLPDQEVRAVKLHETWHKAARHLTTWKYLVERNAKVANMAMDYVVNLFIKDSDPSGKNVRLPAFGLVDEKFRGMDVSEVFEKLLQDGAGQGDGGQGAGGKLMDEHDWESASELTQQEQEELAKEIDSALRQGALIAAKLNGKVDRAIGELLAPQVKWEDELRDFVSSLCSGRDLPSYRKPNRRYMSSNMILPNQIAETVGRIVIAVDTSGSIWGEVLDRFLSEVNSLCQIVKPEGVDLLYWDSHVAGHEKYEEGTYEGMMQSTKPRGGGGTEPQCVVDYMKKKAIRPECIVVLTDGEVYSWGDGWSAPTLWCITEKRIKSPIGKSVYVEV